MTALRIGQSRVLLAGACVATSAAAGWLGSVLAPGSWLWALVGATGAVAATPFVVAAARRRFDVFEPVNLFALGYFVLFVARPASDLTRGGGLPIQLGYPLAPTYADALLIAVVGGVAVLVGYYVDLGRRAARRIPIPTSRWSTDVLAAFVWVGTVVAGALFAAFVATSGGLHVFSSILSGRNEVAATALKGSSGYLYSGPLWLGSLGILVLAITPSWRSPRALAAFALFGASQLTMLALGSRSWTLPFVAMVVVLSYLRRGRRPSLRACVIGLLIVFVVGITIPREYRNTDSRRSLAETATTAFADPASGLRAFLEGDDTGMVGSLAIERRFVPDVIPYQWGKSMAEALTMPVPRAVWPEKPRAAEVLLNETIWPRYWHSGTGFGFSVFGEPFLNFGFVGVALVGLLFGVFWRGTYEWLLREPLSPAVMTLFVLNWPFMVVYLRGGIGADYFRHLIALVPALAAIAVSRLRTRERRVRAGVPVGG